MRDCLANKQIILGVTGGIAAYKSADLVRRLREAGALVRVVMTRNAKEFITPLTMQAVSGHPVHDDLFDLQAEAAMGHIELARWADVVLIAPATAGFMARLAHGEASDLLATVCLATQAPIAIAPAMNQGMWKNTRTQTNLQVLDAKGVHVWGPGEGSQACGDVGAGRMLEPVDLVERVARLFATNLLSGRKVLITAGPTRELIDPIRYLTNASSGKMGYALAEAAREAGAVVTLVSGPVSLTKPARVTCVDVVSAQEMYDAVLSHAENMDILIGVAAVADYRAVHVSPHKIAKTAETLELTLERTPDIIASVAELSKRPYIVGFAAETKNVIEHAAGKLTKKKLNMIIANKVGLNLGFDQDENEVTALWEQHQEVFPLMSKRKLAHRLIELIAREERNHARRTD